MLISAQGRTTLAKATAASRKGGVSHATAVLGAPSAASQSYDVEDAAHELRAGRCS
jgi:hypothetical protein